MAAALETPARDTSQEDRGELSRYKSVVLYSYMTSIDTNTLSLSELRQSHNLFWAHKTYFLLQQSSIGVVQG